MPRGRSPIEHVRPERGCPSPRVARPARANRLAAAGDRLGSPPRGRGRALSAGRAEPTPARSRVTSDPFFPGPEPADHGPSGEEAVVTTDPLPSAPSLEQLRKRAKELLRAHRTGDP
jgi:hypothetical protein